jgi:hypothetical protein
MPKILGCFTGVVERMHTRASESVESPGPSGPDCRALVESGRNERLPFQSIERSVHGAGGNITMHAVLYFL